MTLGVLASPLAQAQLAEPFALAASPKATQAYAGDEARYTITVGNGAVVDRSAKMTVVSQLPPGWTYSFTPDPVALPAGASRNTTLSVFVPNGTAPQTITVTFEAQDSLAAFARDSVNLTIMSRPTFESQPPAPLPPPHVALSVSDGDEAASNATARGNVTLTHDDATRTGTLSVRIAARGPPGWNAYLNPADQNRNLAFGQTTTFPVFVDVPTLAEDTSAVIDITATVDGTTYLARWTVLGRAAPAPAAQNDTSPATTAPTSSAPSTTGPKAGTGPNLEVLVEPLELRIESGAQATALVKLHNSGSTPLELRVMATQPTSWLPADLAPEHLSLAPGERREVTLTLFAPDNIPTGGTATVPVTVVDTSSLTRRAEFLVTIDEPSVPRDRTTTNAATTAPAAPEGSGLPTAGPAVLLAVGLAAVGSGALVLASRPLREKLMWGAVGLYTRLARPDVLGHEDREKLYRLVETQPGIHFHALQRDLAWNTGTLTYHVRVLERHGFVVSRRDGLYRRFYLSGAAPRKETFENQGPTGLRADVLEAVTNTPGISQSDLALGLGANKQTVNYHVKALERAGTIRVEKRGRDTFLYPGGAPVEADEASA